ncbi:protealysin inhibitor emfourin [Agromyces seonyuensis]|uniref:Uncharacterized protein n=1 Tax=Agromyces seonyuensis TaxID=2662446 RepID=A0A6I4NV94_9MICO|nr:protealysin inhibitor emfourin [Agromyces seonyuensis]MWB98021.1 hypothetical protein [Agromyces seonyuensis]
MDVVVVRSGGLAGLRTEWRVDVGAQPDADEWDGLLRSLPWRTATSTAPTPDRYVYRISCASHEATLGEGQLTGPWRSLVDRVQQTVEPTRRSRPPARPRSR